MSDLRINTNDFGVVNSNRAANSLSAANQLRFSALFAQTTAASNSSAPVSSSTEIKTTYDDIFARAAEKYGVPVNLLKAIGKAESNFNAKAVSHCGAQGVMQLMPGTAAGLGVTDSFDPEQNIMGGAKYIAQMLERFNGDTSLALAAYNAGPGAVKKYGGIPPYKETQNYVKTVEKYMGQEITTPSTMLTVQRSGGGSPSKSSNDFADFLANLKSSQNVAILSRYANIMEQSGKEDESGRRIPL